MGAAVIGGVAAGIFDDFEVINRFIKVERVIEPIKNNQEYYKKLVPIFEKSYRSLISVYEDLAGLRLSN
jgi:xylulokinase